MERRILEVCVDSLISSRKAIAGGADRLELCSALPIGGLTPYRALLEQIRGESAIEVRCLMRPRAGDFLYSNEEIQLMESQIRELRKAGADGFVIGCLTCEGKIDTEALKPLIEAADGLKLTLHRAIDVSQNLPVSYCTAARMGFHSVLTSGGAGSCIEGKKEIGQLLRIKEEIDGPEILIGAGVNAEIIREFRQEFQTASAFHMSGKTAVKSKMIFQKEGVPMGIPGYDEWHIPQTSFRHIRAAKEALLF